VITTGQRYGMFTMKTSLDALLEEGVITEAVHNRVLESYG
jgi:hypothetical protein